MQQAPTIVDRIYSDYLGLRQYLEGNGELSHVQLVVDAFRRNLVISAASLFEQLLKDAIIDLSRTRTDGDAAIMCLVRVGVVDRGFHLMFSWKDRSPNSFFAYFGDPLGSAMRKDCANDPKLRDAGRAFLELGQLRNSMVHTNFAMFAFDDSPEEAYAKYLEAKLFVDYILDKFTQPT